MIDMRILAISTALTLGMLAALFFLVWRSLRRDWAVSYGLAFTLSMSLTLLDPYLQPVGGRPNAIHTTIAHLSCVLYALGMNQFVAMPRALARRFLSGVAVVAAVAVLSVSLGWASRPVAFGMMGVNSLLLAVQAAFALRQERDGGMHLVLLCMCLYPATLAVAAWGWFPAQLLRHAGYVPVALAGAAVLTTGLLRAQRQSESAEQALRAFNETLERRVEQRTQALSEANRRLDTANTALQALHASRTRMLAAACHDLRQPTHALGLLAEVALDRATPALRPPIEGIRQCSLALCNMLDMLLDMTQLETERYDPIRESFALDALLQEMQAQFEPLARAKGLELRVARCDLAVETDRHLLRRIVMNLVSNGIKYTDAGHVSVEAQVVGGDVEIRVSDTGAGIPADKRDTVFSDYVRLDRAGRSEGLGIGLAIVKRAASLLGHGLHLDSAVGRGTIVRLTLPPALPVPAPQEDGAWVAGRGRVIGVVENDASILSAVTQLLSSHGFRVAAARDGAELQQALASAGAQAPDLLIADLHLGAGQDGLTLMSALKAQPGWSHTAFLLVTGDLDAKVAHDVAALGAAAAYKPVPPRRLLRLLDQLLAHRPAVDAVPALRPV